MGSLLSINSLREDLDVAFETVRSWLSALERVHIPARVQVSLRGRVDRLAPKTGRSGVRLVTAARFLANLP